MAFRRRRYSTRRPNTARRVRRAVRKARVKKTHRFNSVRMNPMRGGWRL